MIDNCKGIIFYESEEEATKVFDNPFFVHQRKGISKFTGEPIHFFELLNLRVRYYPMSKKVRFENSIHKLRHDNNYCDFTFSQLNETCNFISDSFEKNMKEIMIQNFEFALIIETEQQPEFYFNRFMNLRLKPFYDMPPPPNIAKPIERFCPFNQYTIKFYNAGKWNNLKGVNLLKEEIQFKKMNRVYEITGRSKQHSPITILDFTHKPFLDSMANFHLSTYRNIEKLPFADCSQLKPHTRDFLFAGLLNEYWAEEKRINTHTAKKKRTRYLHLRKEVERTGNEPFKELERKFQDKYSQLVNS
jgi:hypothetical protein